MQHTLYLLRHGELETQQVLAGSTDFSLSSYGLQQLQEVAHKLPEIHTIFSSPLSRCQHFAAIFAQEQGLMLDVSCLLKEMDFGDWDGLPFADLWKNTQNNKVGIGDFWQNPWENTPPNGETMHSFTLRVDQWWQQWLKAMPQGNSLVVTHAGVIKHLLARIVGLDVKTNNQLSVFDVPYAGLIKIEVYFDERHQPFPRIIF